jgi:two-component system chemotaxis response regulator CheY
MKIDKDITILVADDSAGIRTVAKKMFKNLGYSNVTIVDDGTAAWEYLQQYAVDLVVADWNMPKLSGVDLAQKMRRTDKFKNIPFLLVTAEETQDDILAAILAGVSNYMTKPYDAEALQEKIEKIFTFQERKSKRIGSVTT